jgi:hypothetical protein
MNFSYLSIGKGNDEKNSPGKMARKKRLKKIDVKQMGRKNPAAVRCAMQKRNARVDRSMRAFGKSVAQYSDAQLKHSNVESFPHKTCEADR